MCCKGLEKPLSYQLKALKNVVRPYEGLCLRPKGLPCDLVRYLAALEIQCNKGLEMRFSYP